MTPWWPIESIFARPFFYGNIWFVFYNSEKSEPSNQRTAMSHSACDGANDDRRRSTGALSILAGTAETSGSTSQAGRFHVVLFPSFSTFPFLIFLLFFIPPFSSSFFICFFHIFFDDYFPFSFDSSAQSLEIGQLRTPTWRQVVQGTQQLTTDVRRRRRHPPNNQIAAFHISVHSRSLSFSHWRLFRSHTQRVCVCVSLYVNIAIKPSPDVVCVCVCVRTHRTK